MNATEARRRFADARVAILATVDGSSTPHVVPVTFVVEGSTLWSAVDAKPKRRTELRRLANIRVQPRVSLLVHHWDEVWTALWWVRADGVAVVTEVQSTMDHVADLLRRKYDQYQEVDLYGPVIEVAIRTWRGWRASPPHPG